MATTGEPLSPPGTEIIYPYLNRRNRYKPKIGDKLTVDIPGERIRAEIRGVVNDDIVLVEILSVPVGRSANDYPKGMLAQARRDIGDHDIEIWKVISERELQQQEMRNRLEAEERQRVEDAERERVAAVRKRDLAAQAAEKRKRKVAAK